MPNTIIVTTEEKDLELKNSIVEIYCNDSASYISKYEVIPTINYCSVIESKIDDYFYARIVRILLLCLVDRGNGRDGLRQQS